MFFLFFIFVVCDFVLLLATCFVYLLYVVGFVSFVVCGFVFIYDAFVSILLICVW